MRIALTLALTVTGCDLFNDSDGDPNNYVALGDLDKAYQAAYCKYATRCGLFPDAATCEGAELFGAGTIVIRVDPDTIAAVGAGRAYYMGSNVKACFDMIANQTCDQSDRDGRVLDMASVCNDVIRGTVAGGGTCTIDSECISGSCSSGGGCTMGTCIGDTPRLREPAGLGQQCSPFCAEGLFCDSALCATLKVAGSICLQNRECGYGLMCLLEGTTGMRTCKPPPALDQPCPDAICRDFGQYCNTTCKQVGLPPAQCTSSSQCSPYYPCDFTTTPQCKKGPSLGQPCAGGTCFDRDTFCDTSGVTPMCAARRPNGSACTTSIQCQSQLCNNQICEAPPTCF